MSQREPGRPAVPVQELLELRFQKLHQIRDPVLVSSHQLDHLRGQGFGQDLKVGQFPLTAQDFLLYL